MVMLLVSSEMCMSVDARDGGENGKICGKGMNAAWQISRRFGRRTGARARSAADYSITATISVVPLKVW